AHVGGEPLQFVHVLDDLLDAVAQQHRLRRQLQAPAHATEQGEAELVLGVLQRLAGRRLRNVEQLRRPGQAAGGQYRMEQFDVAQAHGAFPPLVPESSHARAALARAGSMGTLHFPPTPTGTHPCFCELPPSPSCCSPACRRTRNTRTCATTVSASACCNPESGTRSLTFRACGSARKPWCTATTCAPV